MADNGGSPRLSLTPTLTQRTTQNDRLAKLKKNISNRLKRPAKTEFDLYPPEEPKELPTPLTTLANRETMGIDDLDNILPVSDPEDVDDFDRNLAALLNGVHPHEHRDPRVRSVNIPKSNVQITPFQFNQACRILLQYPNHGLSGGILANSPGTGKSYIMIAALLLRAMIFESKREVHQYWQEVKNGERKSGERTRHLPRHTQDDDLRKCPSQDPGGIVCYCVRHSLTSRIADKGHRGVSVLQVPTETLSDWYANFDNAILRLNGSPSKLYMLSNAPPARFRIRPTELKKLLPKLDPSDENLPKTPESYIFLTSLQGFQLLNAFSTPEGQFSLTIGLHMVDEAHQILASERATVMRMSESQSACDKWYVTGTPFRNGSLTQWVPAITRIDWKRGALLESFGSQLQGIRESRDQDETDKYLMNLSVIFDKIMVLRHFPTSTMFNKPLTGLQSMKPKTISRVLPENYREAVQTLASEVQSTLDPALDYAKAFLACSEARIGRDRLNFVSLFPAAAPLMLDDPTAFDDETIIGMIEKTPINKLLIENQPELKELSSEIAHDSPKLDYIHEEIDRMLSDKRARAADPHAEFKKEQDAQAEKKSKGKGKSRIPMLRGRLQNQSENLTAKKMVIFTPTVASAAMLYLAISQARKDLKCVYYYSRAGRAHREIALDKFNSILGDKATAGGQVFITNYAAAGTGINLQKAASYQILTSKLPTKANETQGFARTNREGQRLAVTHKILILEDNPIDRIMVCEHAGAKMTSNPFEINEELTFSIPEVGLKTMKGLPSPHPQSQLDHDCAGSLEPGSPRDSTTGVITVGIEPPSPRSPSQASPARTSALAQGLVAPPAAPKETYEIEAGSVEYSDKTTSTPSTTGNTTPPQAEPSTAFSPATPATEMASPSPVAFMGRFHEHLGSDSDSLFETRSLLGGNVDELMDTPRKKSKFSFIKSFYKKEKGQ